MKRIKQWAETLATAIVITVALIAIILLIIDKERDVNNKATGTCNACGNYGLHLVKRQGKHLIFKCNSCGCTTRERA